MVTAAKLLTTKTYSHILFFPSTDYTDHDYHHHSLDTEMNDLKNVNKLNVFSPSPDTLESKSEVDIWCIECNLNFESQSTYENHMSSDHNKPSKVVVSASKSFVCPTCNKCFAEKKILNRHLKIHDPIKSHACNVCDMTFAESSNLTKHLKKHTGELRNVVGKPNLCSACGKRFKWFVNLIAALAPSNYNNLMKHTILYR